MREETWPGSGNSQAITSLEGARTMENAKGAWGRLTKGQREAIGMKVACALDGSNSNADEVYRRVLADELKVTLVGNTIVKPASPRIIGLPTTYDLSLGLVPLIERGVGPGNLGNINRNITVDRFPPKGTGVRKVNLHVEPYLNGETSEQAAPRLVAAGFTLEDTAALAGYLHDHPEEVEKWAWVLAISENSRWSGPGGFVRVPYAYVGGACRGFGLGDFRDRLDSGFGVLVSCESGT